MSEERSDRLGAGLARLGRFAHRRAGLVAGLLVLSLVPFGLFARGLEVRSSFLDLLPHTEPPVAQLEEVLAHARSTSDVAVGIDASDRDRAERFGRALVAALDDDPQIAGIGGYVDRSALLRRRLLFVPDDELASLLERARLAIDREIERHSPFYLGLDDEEEGTSERPDELLAELERSEERFGSSDWVATRDGRYLVVWAYFSGNTGDLAFGRQAWDRVRATVERLREGEFAGLEVRYAGGIPTRVEDERVLVGDLSLAGAIGFGAVVLLIVVALRTPRALVLLAVPLFTGLVWTFAFARLAVGHLNIISGFLFSILSGLGIEYGIHLLHRYRELRAEGLPLEPAIEKLLATTGRALLSGSMTNAGVFAVIALADFEGFSEFGLIASVGLLLTLAATLLGMPALLAVFERWRPLPHAPEADHDVPIRVPAALRRAVVFGVPALALVSLGLVMSGVIRFDGNWRHLVSDTETTQFGQYLRHQLAGTYDQALLWVPRDADLPRVAAVLDALRDERAAAGASFDIVDVVGLDEVFPSAEAQARRAAIVERLGAELDRIEPGYLDEDGLARLRLARELVEGAVPFGLDAMPYSVVGHFLTQDESGSIVHLSANESDDSNTDLLVAWAEQAEAISERLREASIEAPMLSENWIAGEIFARIRDDAGFLSVATLLAVLLVLLLDLRRPLVSLGVLGSVLIGVVSMAGLAHLVGVRLNFMNVAILPICVSISLDNAIHVYHRWHEAGRGSIERVLRQTTRANALASATNLLGFLALVLTHHEGLRSVAAIATVGVLATYVSTTLWFPMVLDTLDRRAAR